MLYLYGILNFELETAINKCFIVSNAKNKQ